MSTIGTIQKTTGQDRTFLLDISAIATWLTRAFEKRRSRRALLLLNDEQLKDIGLSRSQAYAEGARPFWK